MKRLHVHIKVENLAATERFYTTLFGVAPDVLKDDYAQWMLDDPRVNFAISTSCGKGGIDHLGIQFEEADDLARTTERLKAAEAKVFEEADQPCCYAVGEKTWTSDPAGVIWETFLRTGTAETMGPDTWRDAQIDALEPDAAGTASGDADAACRG